MRSDRNRWEKRYAERLATGGSPATQEPSAFVLRHADRIRGRVLDVAAGTGRNALFLARRGCRVDAIDISFTALQALHHAAAGEGLAINLLQADLQDFPLPANVYDAVLNVRYLERSLFPSLVRAVHPGGLILFETFIKFPGRATHVHNPAFLLRPGELRQAFADCDVLVYEEGEFTTEGGDAVLARLLARRPVPARD